MTGDVPTCLWCPDLRVNYCVVGTFSVVCCRACFRACHLTIERDGNDGVDLFLETPGGLYWCGYAPNGDTRNTFNRTRDQIAIQSLDLR